MDYSLMSAERRLHDNNFNLIRLVLATLVLLSHSFELIDGDNRREPLVRLVHTTSLGDLAVCGFFLISGYLIVGSYLSRPEPLHFLKNRILRIFPGFLVCVIFSVVLVGYLGGGKHYFRQIDIIVLLKALPELGQIQGLPPVFQSSYYPDVNGSLWSLKPEFRCYLLALAFGMCGLFSSRWAWPGLGLGCALIYSAFYSGIHFPHIDMIGDNYLFINNTLRLVILFIGGGCLRLLGPSVRLSTRLTIIFSLLVLICLVSRRFAVPALSVFGGYIFLNLACVRAEILAKFRKLPDISYGTYLYGWPIQKLLLLYFGGLEPLPLFCMALPLAWFAGAGSWYCVEKPALALRRFDLLPSLRRFRSH